MSSTSTPNIDPFPLQPVLARVWRGEHLESQHRGAWVLCNGAGEILDGRGDGAWPVFARSSIKSLQALPLLESGAARHYAYGDAELALALASHSGEPVHTEGVARILERLKLSVADLGCGSQEATDPATRSSMACQGQEPSAIHNNCSGKHAGFLTLARHLQSDPASYLDPAGLVQQCVREAVLEMTGLPEDKLTMAVDGCNAPTFRMPLVNLATAFARLTSPGAAGLVASRREACERMFAAANAHPVMVAGSHGRLCTRILEAGAGRLFPKVGAEAVYAVGLAGGDRALAVKIDDGGGRALAAVVVSLLRRLGFLDENVAGDLIAWAERPLKNRIGREVGRIEVAA